MNNKQKLYKELCEEMANGKIGDEAKVDCEDIDCLNDDCPLSNMMRCDVITEKGKQIAQQYLAQLKQDSKRKDENMEEKKFKSLDDLKVYNFKDIVKSNLQYVDKDDLNSLYCFADSDSLNIATYLKLSDKEFILKSDYDKYLKDTKVISPEETIKQQVDEINRLNNQIAELIKDRDNYKKAYEDIKVKKNNSSDIKVTVNDKNIDTNKVDANNLISTIRDEIYKQYKNANKYGDKEYTNYLLKHLFDEK